MHVAYIYRSWYLWIWILIIVLNANAKVALIGMLVAMEVVKLIKIIKMHRIAYSYIREWNTPYFYVYFTQNYLQTTLNVIQYI